MRLFLITLLFALASCQTADRNTVKTLDDSVEPSQDPQASSCPGEVYFFTMNPSAQLPAQDAIGYYAPPLHVFAPDISYKFRLKICLDEPNGHATLMEAKFWFEQNYNLVKIPDDQDVVEGLFDALFGDVAGLHIKLHMPNRFDPQYEIRGHTSGEFITAASVRGDPLAPKYGIVFVGLLEEGDPFAGHLCGAAPQKEYDLTFDTLKLKLTRCEFGGGGQTLGYEYKIITLTDTNEKLPAIQRGQTTVLDIAAIANQTSYQYAHHNDHDWLEINHQGVKYKLSHLRNDSIVNYTANYGVAGSVEKSYDTCRYYWVCGENLGGIQGPGDF